VASTASETRLVLVSCTDPGAVQFHTVLYSLLHFACWFKTGIVNVYVCGLASWWQDLERRLVLVSCTDPGVVEFYLVVYDLIQFARWFRTGALDVYVCGLASWWQVQSWKDDWFWYLAQTLVQCNFTWLYMPFSILPFNSRQVSSMSVFLDWPVVDKYRHKQKIGRLPCLDLGVV